MYCVSLYMLDTLDCLVTDMVNCAAFCVREHVCFVSSIYKHYYYYMMCYRIEMLLNSSSGAKRLILLMDMYIEMCMIELNHNIELSKTSRWCEPLINSTIDNIVTCVYAHK